MKHFLLALNIMFLGAAAMASNYPADYPVYSDTRQDGPVKIQRSLQGGGYVALEIDYTGELSHANSPLWVTVIANYTDGQRVHSFPMVNDGNGTYHVRVTNGCLVGKLGGCAAEGTPEMKDLLQWASDYGYTLNALDVEFTFSTENGQWDPSQYRNYRFQFPHIKGF